MPFLPPPQNAPLIDRVGDLYPPPWEEQQDVSSDNDSQTGKPVLKLGWEAGRDSKTSSFKAGAGRIVLAEIEEGEFFGEAAVSAQVRRIF